jgi:hypothetical protein
VSTASPVRPDISDALFWRRPLAERMADFAVLREAAPFTPGSAVNALTGEPEHFWAVTRYADVGDISKRPQVFCSGKGSI